MSILCLVIHQMKLILKHMKLPVVAVMSSVFSLHKTDIKVVFPALVRPMHTNKYSALATAGFLQHSR